MGVPKFFRYISERYPCLSELVKEYQIPEFDNLYLDMNGIVHMCSHPDDNNPHFRITEERIFKDIFHYIEVLFRMIRPQKLFFMAVDGVAPRAKMNQQRGRRFRTAKDAEKQEADALKKGEKLPEEARFDSNCITPGTVFMARLHEQLQYFVVNKISSDPTWQKCKIILSGHETPGEGEHKIMDYIRYMRAQPGYDPNTRHCLYGLDADLIMLGLCTHEPHFSLLREEVKFGKKSTKRANCPEEITFYLLHLSLMREYLELEFAPLRNKLQGFQYDLEKIIDDWVLMGFLVGNDFIPHLPNLHIANGALPILYKAYIEALPTLDGYINEAGTLNLARFEKFMEKLSSIDFENFEEIKEDLDYMEAKTGKKWNAHFKVSSKTPEQWESEDKEVYLEALEPEKPKDSGMLALINATNDMLLDSDGEESEEEDPFEIYKRGYYMNKLEYAKVTPEVLRDQAEGYVRAIQWNLNYYYNGCCSWSWYYPHHYAPYISDIKGFSNLKIEFELGKPFLPYEQLLAVLPMACRNLLPTCYHHLMMDEDSLIKKYYPEDFQTDLNGKKQEWEAVVLVPFIDENVLLEAMKECNDKLTPEEKQRNSHGPMLIYNYTSESRGPYPAPEYFPAILESHAEILKLNYDDVLIPKDKLVKGAYPGVRLNVYYPGFPTLKHLKYKAELKKAKIRVFESPSRNENMVISILNDRYLDDKIPVDLLGTVVWVGWPHLVEAKVVCISNQKWKYISMGESNAYNVEARTGARDFADEVQGITEYYRNRMGIEVGDTKVLVHVQVMTGRRYAFSQNGRINLEKVFTPNIAYYPLQSVVSNISSHDSHHSTFRNILDVFPVGCTCFILASLYYGSPGTVQDCKEVLKSGRLKICLSVSKEPDLSSINEMHAKVARSYKTLYHTASQLSISNFLFSRITGSVFLSARNGEGGLKSVNVGLDLKFNKKNKETPGYTKKIDNTWLYTDRAVDLVRQYMDKYPEVFEYLSEDDRFDDISVESIFKDDWEEKLKELQNWLRSLPTHSVERQSCGGSALELNEVKEIERIVDEYQKTVTEKKTNIQIKPNFLYRSEVQNGTLPPDPKASTQVLDRIVNVRSGFSVPFGLKGTVISIQKPLSGLDRDTMYDVVFDKPFPDGMSLNCSDGRGYRLPNTAFINISYGQRIMVEKTGKPGDLIAKAESAQRNGNNVFNQQYNNPQPQRWLPMQNRPSQPFAPVQPSFQNENTAFAQFNSASTLNRPQPNAQYQTRAFQDFYKGDNNPVKQSSSFNQPQENYSPQKQKYQNGSNVDTNRRSTNYQRGNDFMPSFNSPSQKEEKPQGQQYEQKQLQSQTTPDKQMQNPRPSVNVDILKTILKIGKEREAKDQTKLSAKTDDTNKSNSKQNPPSTSQNPTENMFDMFAKAAKAPASVRLLTYYQSNGLGLPRYQYFKEGNLIRSKITLSNGEYVIGAPAMTNEEASENVAADVLNIFLKGGKATAPVQTETVHPTITNDANEQVNTSRTSASSQKTESTNWRSTKSTVLNNSFVPLQAVKAINRTSNVSNKGPANAGAPRENITEKQENREAFNRNNRYKGHNSQNRNKPQRKTRIAANFDLLKNTGPPKP